MNGQKQRIGISRISRLGIISLMISMFLSLAMEIAAQTRYVDPTGEAVVRRGQGTKYKVVAVVKEGTAVELLEEGDGYALVRLDNGKQGWIISRYLDVDPPPTELVIQLKEQAEELRLEKDEMDVRLDELTDALAGTKSEIHTLTDERDRIAEDYHKLQRDTADVMKIRQNMEATAEENTKLAERIMVLEQENGKMKKDKAINWFLAGGGVLFFGILLGKMPGPSKRRKSSLLS